MAAPSWGKWMAVAALAALLGSGIPAAAGAVEAQPTVRLSIVGGLATVTQFTKFEKPFWEQEITARSNGRIVATIRPFDGGGLRGQEMLQLLRLGVVPYGNVLLSLVSADEPELDAPDLPLVNPDFERLRQTVGLYREHMREILRDRYGIVLLGVYVYPAQVLYCENAFAGLDDLAGRKVRTSAVGQSDLMSALGALPVIVPFADIVPAVTSNVADCAITGTLSGYEIGLGKVTSHLHGMAITWGLSFFGANMAAFDALPPDVQDIIRDGVADLEARIWQQAEVDTERGIACNTGSDACIDLEKGTMTLVNAPADETRRKALLLDVVLARWVDRCGQACVSAWNAYLAAATGVSARAP
jgi:TRAP-type C4-dicarboxylate transport system substrate-binding protein